MIKENFIRFKIFEDLNFNMGRFKMKDAKIIE